MKQRTFIFSLILFTFACQAWAQRLPPIDPSPITPPYLQNGPPALVNVQGNGRVRVPPDQVEVTVGITQRANTVAAVQSQVDTVSANIIAYLKRNGVEDRDIQTTVVSLYPFYNDTTGDGQVRPVFYTASKSITFTLRNVARFDRVLAGLYGVGANTVSGVTWKLDDPQEAKQEAKRRAVAQAQEIAEALTDELDVSVGDVYSVNDQTHDNQYYPVVYGAADFRGSSGSSVARGVVEVTATVSVSYYISDNWFNQKTK